MRPPRAPWNLPPSELLASLGTRRTGLTPAEAARRLQEHGRNELHARARTTRLGIVARQLKSPLLLLLVFASAVSIAAGDWIDTALVLAIVIASVGLAGTREWRAERAAALLQARIRSRAQVLRGGASVLVPVEEVVPGDVLLLRAGTLVCADAVVLEAGDLHVNEAVLTGESFPAEKRSGVLPAETPLARRTSCVFQGTNVRSGTATCVVVATGGDTAFGGIAERLAHRPPETEFDRGLRRFGALLTKAMFVMVVVVFTAHVLRDRPPLETLLFAVALGVGLSPELLPAVLGVNLARGADEMVRHGVLVRRLAAIENLGSMDILCTDKTGTLTVGVVEVGGAFDPGGVASDVVLEAAALVASLATGLPSPLDEALVKARAPQTRVLRKLAEIPFDFVRKRVSVVVETPEGCRLVTKGAVDRVLEVCARLADGTPLDPAARRALRERHATWSRQGMRVVAVATRDVDPASSYGRDDERELVLLGFVTFLDQPKEGAREAIASLAALGVTVKVITGDAELVARHVASLVGLPEARVLTGAQLDQLTGEALWREAERTDLFVEVDPNQKERIILSLKKMGHVVGFLGDGVNDAPAMHAADTSISVEQAADVAREAADFVLLERHLDVIRRGIEEGRRTFANTLKYVLTTTSANLGNMISMAVASLFLPFLPLLAGQVLLNNFLSDIPALGIASDAVDRELVDRPRRWDMRFIGRFMIEFGLLSSVFDLLTFAGLLAVFHASEALFRTGWFVESLLTELVIALVVRTRRPFWTSRPGNLLLASTIALVVLTFAVPYLPFAGVLGFVPAPPALLLALAAAAALYVAAAEVLKRWFYRGA